VRPYSAVIFDLGNTLVYRIVTQERTLRLVCEENDVAMPENPDFRGAVAVWRAYHSAHYLSARSPEEESLLGFREAEAVLRHLAGEEAASRHAADVAPAMLNSPR
jgi:hypothetical protein